MRVAAALILCFAPLAAEAKPSRYPVPVQEFAGDRWVRVGQAGTTARDVTRAIERRKSKRHPMPRPRPKRYPAPGEVKPIGMLQGMKREAVEAMPSRWLVGIVPPLAAKAREIVAACESKVISGVRHTRIAGTGGRLSLHASGRAVDIAGNPSCIYAKLHGWPGGYSIDYARVAHVHISHNPGGSEWGLRFNHYRGGKHRKRHKHRRRA